MQQNITTFYRKYRPLTFDDVVGQDAIITTLKNQIKNNKVAHAYLFCGTRGTGKTTVAKILARAVNCENLQNENPCNECDACKSILAQDANLDVIEMDAASNTGIEDVRVLKEHIDYPPTMSKKKVFIIDEAHALSQKACEALLKTIEEPPEYVLFILATTDPEQLKETIRSRCQRFDFKRIPIPTIVDRLKYIANNENVSYEEKALEYIALKGDGSMRDSISLLDKAQAFCKGECLTYEKALESLGVVDVSEWKKLLDNIKNEKTTNCIKQLKSYLEDGKDILRFVSDFIWYIRSLIIAKQLDDGAEFLEMSKEKFDELKKDSANYENIDLIFYIEEFSKLLNKMKYAEEKRILLETELIRLCTPRTIYTNEAILARLEKLEKKLNSNSFIKVDNVNPEMIKDQQSEEVNNINKKNKIILPKATYEELIKYQNDWSSFVGIVKVSHIKKEILRLAKVHIKNKDTSTLRIVCDSDFSYGIISDNETKQALIDASKERYSKEINYEVVLDDTFEIENTVYATEEDFAKINMEIEVNDDSKN